MKRSSTADTSHGENKLYRRSGEQTQEDEKEKFYQRLYKYNDAELRMIYEYYKVDLIYIVGSLKSRTFFSNLEQWTKLSIEAYGAIIDGPGDAVVAERLVQDILGAGREAVIGFWKYLYDLKDDKHPHPNIEAVLEEIIHTGDSLVKKIILDKHGHNLTPDLKDIQKQHKNHLLENTRHLVEHRPPGSTQGQQSFYISERYVNMVVVSSDNFRQRSQHELIETGRKHEDIMKKTQLLLEHITINKLFRWSRQKQWDPRVVMVSGVPGVGKTTMMQKFVYDWVTGKLYQRFAFVFFFKFRDLNRMDEISLETMILQEYTHLQSHLRNILQDPEKLLFIFDGLDESNHQMDSTSSQLYDNVKQKGRVGLVVVSLLRQSLLRGCSVLLTSRPSKLASVDTRLFHRVSEIMGFSPREIQMYFDRFFQNKDLSEKAIHHVRENDTLYTFCYIPSYCWIICTVFSMCFKTQPKNTDHLMPSLPKTVTQLFVTFVSNILSNHSQDNSRARELMTSIGWMAEHGVMNHLIVFDERDMRSFSVDNSSHLTSGFIIEFKQPPNVTFSFLHLTVQEFLAALVHYIDYSPEKLQRSLDKNKSYRDGRGEMFLSFLCGFLDSSSRSLQKYLGDFSIRALKDVTGWLQKSFVDFRNDAYLHIEKHLNIFSCLYESQNKTLTKDCLGSNRNFSLTRISHLTPVDCTVLAFVLESCRETESLDIKKCNIQSEGWKNLAPALHTIKTIKLSRTDLSYSCLQHIISALCHSDGRTQHLELVRCGITEESCPHLSSVVSNNRSLRTLDLSHNNLSGRHFCDLMMALSSPTCRIQELLLKKCGITEELCPQLSSVVRNNLRTLDLSDNNLSGPHFRDLMTALSSPTCRIQRLLLSDTHLTDEETPHLVSLSNNTNLINLDLGFNRFQEQGHISIRNLIQRSPSLTYIRIPDRGLSQTQRNDLENIKNPNLRIVYDESIY